MNERPERYTILRLSPQDKPVYFVIKMNMKNDEAEEYYVDEGTCPTNLFIGGVEEIIIDGDTDAHGLFEFVRTIPIPDFVGTAHCQTDEWAEIIPEAFDAQQARRS